MTMLWDASWNVGIDVIDAQHKRIVEYINALETAITHQQHAVIGQVLAQLTDDTESHFAFEESLQQEVGYEYAIPHQATHKTFVARIKKYQTRHDAGEDIASQLHTMLSTWLVHHISRDDAAYVKAVHESMRHVLSNTKEDGWLKRSLKRFFG